MDLGSGRVEFDWQVYMNRGSRERKADGRKRGCLGTETGFYVRGTELQCSGGPSRRFR